MKIINRNKKKFNKIVKLLINILEKDFNLKFKHIIESKDNSLIISGRFSNTGLKRYSVGIWGCGKWSNTYDITGVDRISIFLIHDWRLDKFIPSRADYLFDLLLTPKFYKENIQSEIHKLGKMLYDMNKSPINTYYSISEFHSNSNPKLNYLIDFYYNEIYFPFSNNLKYKWSVIFLYYVLSFISKLDKNVNRSKLFEEDNTIPRYTISFLATEDCSNDDSKWNRFCKLYNIIPEKLCRLFKYKLFNCHFSVSDYNRDMTEEEVMFRMKRGVIV